MIRSYRDARTEALARGKPIKSFPADLVRRVVRKLTILEYAVALDDLVSPPGNRLESLKGNRRGQYSIRVNDQWGICFIWTKAGPELVEVTDYH
jgi:proteic killer suppression protein